MKIKVVASTDAGRFIATDGRYNYYVLTIHRAGAVRPGDILVGEFRGEIENPYTIRNTSQKRSFKIRLEHYDNPSDIAVEFFLRELKAGTAIYTIKERLVSDALDIVHDLTREILTR